MPEGPEVRIVADFIQTFVGTNFSSAIIVENTNKVHRFTRSGISNFEKLKSFLIVDVKTKGKLISIQIKNEVEALYVLVTLGMSGTWLKNGRNHKHARISFLSDTFDVTFIDPRCFGTIRIVNEAQKEKVMSKIGHDFLNGKMSYRSWMECKEDKRISNMEIGEALMCQRLFSGIGNIYKSEIIYDCQIDPRTKISEIDNYFWLMINESAHKILLQAYRSNGSTVSTFSSNGESGHNQLNLIVYKKAFAKEGPVESFIQAGRMTWWCPGRVSVFHKKEELCQIMS